ncbi:MAG TPA: cupin domain-containing protein [Gemmatimonadaceae bacterium]|nr:cupin domain-containing protein [Gemmatimonadaceae bacterium]
MTRSIAVRCAAVAVALMITGAAFAQHPHVLVPADKVKWGPALPALPAGAQISVLEGDPGQKGAITLRLQFAANYTLPPHWHSMTERVTVLSGALHVGMGDTLDRQHSQTLQPGGFVSLPAKMHHYAWTATPTIVQINLEGPFDIFYVNPADDPQGKKGNR